MKWLTTWENIGVYNVLLPFLLVFTLTFAVLQKIKLFGKEEKNVRGINVVVSFVIALLFVRNQYLVELVNRFLPNISMFLVVILMFLLLIGLFGGGSQWKGWMLGLATIVSLVFVIWALTADKLFVNGPSWLSNIDPQTKSTILFVAVFVIVIYIVVREPKSGGEDEGNWAKKALEGIAKHTERKD
ncbi:MAG: hypothetical protein PHG05_01140 [Candidatus Nanoarchaeia archaeon]|nr:hypothetical protein [Candidatus Nanoarchaeia archaeon]